MVAKGERKLEQLNRNSNEIKQLVSSKRNEIILLGQREFLSELIQSAELAPVVMLSAHQNQLTTMMTTFKEPR